MVLFAIVMLVLGTIACGPSGFRFDPGGEGVGVEYDTEPPSATATPVPTATPVRLCEAVTSVAAEGGEIRFVPQFGGDRVVAFYTPAGASTSEVVADLYPGVFSFTSHGATVEGEVRRDASANLSACLYQ